MPKELEFGQKVNSFKNIAFFIQSLEGGGAEKVVISLAREMTRIGHHVHIILMQNKIDYILDFSVEIHLFLVPAKKSWFQNFYYMQGIRFKEFIDQLENKMGRFDLIISNLTEADRISSAANLSRTFFCIHSATSNQKLGSSKGVRRLLRRKKYQKIYNKKNIIAVSNGVALDLIENMGVKPKSIRTIYNPFDFEVAKKLTTDSDEIPFNNYIIHIGSFKYAKRHDILLYAFAQSGLTCQLVLLGQGTLETEIRNLAHQLGIENRVVFVGFKPNPYPYIKKAKLLVLSSDYEGFALVLVEALACGVPVVSTDCPYGPNEILTENLSHGLVPVGDIKELAIKMRSHYGTGVSEHLDGLDRFNIHKIVDQYISLCS